MAPKTSYMKATLNEIKLPKGRYKCIDMGSGVKCGRFDCCCFTLRKSAVIGNGVLIAVILLMCSDKGVLDAFRDKNIMSRNF